MRKRMLVPVTLLLMVSFFAAGCSKKPKATACDLLSLVEVQAIDESVVRTEAMPPNDIEKNELCLYSDSADERRVMLFVWHDGPHDPLRVVRSGMTGAGSRVVEVSGVGEKAAAGFRDGELKLFNAVSGKAMVGLRVRDPVKEGDAKYEAVKTLAVTALGRVR